MINEINVVSGGFVSPVIIIKEVPPDRDKWITVLIGENGTKKSFLLRLLTEAALGRTRFRHTAKRRYTTVSIGENVLPARVIAISGTPLDRFPRAGTTSLNSSKNRRLSIDDPFVYLGQRAANGMAGAGQSERSLVGSLLTNRSRLQARKTALTDVFGHLGLRPRVEVIVKLASGRDSEVAKLVSSGNLRAFRDALNTQFFELRAKLGQDSVSLRYLKDIEAFRLRLTSTDALKAFREHLSVFSEATHAFSLAPTRSNTKFDLIGIADWEVLLRTGIVEIAGTQFVRSVNVERKTVARQYLHGDELSSGQWSWLSGMAGLTVELRPNCLILIDEPENSLHPTWQREYVSHIEKITRPYSKIQVVIATHSPLIASGVSPEFGNVRHLHRRVDEENDVILVQSDEETSTYGWTANDVYEAVFDISSTRAEGFTLAASKALQLIKKGERIDVTDSDRYESELTMAARSLPPFDPLREVFLNIVKSLKKLTVR